MSEDRLALDAQLCFALSVATRKVVAAYKEPLEPLGLTHPQYLAMLALWGSSPQSLGELSRTLALDAATMSPLIKRLEAQGLVSRQRRAGDERSLDIGLTSAGVALREKAEAVPVQVAEMFHLSESELIEIRDMLHKVIAAADGALTAAD